MVGVGFWNLVACCGEFGLRLVCFGFVGWVLESVVDSGFVGRLRFAGLVVWAGFRLFLW